MSRLVYDIEANGLLATVTEVHCIVTHDLDTGMVGRYHNHPHLAQSEGSLQDGIDKLSSASELIGHNIISYDLRVLKKLHGMVYTGKVTDTLVMSKLLYPDRSPVKGVSAGPHALGSWGVRLGIAKPHHEDWKTFSADMLVRAMEDVRINVALYDHMLLEEWGEWPWGRGFNIEQKVEGITQDAAEHGWPFDKTAALSHIETLTKRIDEIEAEVIPKIPLIPKPKEANLKEETRVVAIEEVKEALGYSFSPEFITELRETLQKGWVHKPFLKSGKPTAAVKKFMEETADQIAGPFCRIEWNVINLASDKQVKKYLLSIGWRPLEWNISKKTHEVTSPKLTEESLDSLRNPIGKLIAERIKAAHRRSQIEGWVEAMREDGRVPSVVNALGTPTARMSHKIIANVPSIDNGAFFAEEMRGVFISDPGYKIVGCDAASCQLRLLCAYMSDDAYTEAVLYGNSDDGTDIHSVNMRATGVANRTQAKRVVYSFLFGGGPARVGSIVGGGKAAGKRTIDSFLNNLPKLKALRTGIEEAWKERGYLIGLDGRKIFVRKKHMLLCYLLQSAEAILMKFALCILTDWIKQEGLDANLVCVYHDEYSFHVKEEHTERVSFLAEQAITEAGKLLKLGVPMEGNAKVGESWGDVH